MSNKQTEKRTRKQDPVKIKWVVNPHRKDKRTGALDPVPMDRYTRYAFDEIERFFHGEKKEQPVLAAKGKNHSEGGVDE